MAAVPRISPALHRFRGGAADGMLGYLERDACDARRAGNERVHRDAKSRRDGAADIETICINDVDIGRGSEVDDDRRCAVVTSPRQRHSRCGRRPPRWDWVRAVLSPRRSPRLQQSHAGRCARRPSAIHARAGRTTPANATASMQSIGKAVHLQIAEKANVQLVGSKRTIRGHAPRADERIPVKQSECGLRIAHIDGEEHGSPNERRQKQCHCIPAALTCCSPSTACRDTST